MNKEYQQLLLWGVLGVAAFAGIFYYARKPRKIAELEPTEIIWETVLSVQLFVLLYDLLHLSPFLLHGEHPL